jgi:YHS domain-containing protein
MKTLLQFTAALALLTTSAFAGDLVNVSGASKVALSGYDPVAFFTDAKPVNGSPFITAEYQGATYFFANEDHKKLFAAKSDSYVPQFGGYCAFGVALDKLLPVDISTWQVRDGKLYLNLNAEILKGFNADFDANLAKANKNWVGLQKHNATPVPAAQATTPTLVNVSGASKTALSGYDAVAFFTDAKALNGSPFISAEYQGASYFFVSEDHKKLFTANPDKYAPQFGGFCAFGAALGKVLPVDINTWQVRDGKLYLNLNADILKGFNADFDAQLAKANKNWPSLVKQYGS